MSDGGLNDVWLSDGLLSFSGDQHEPVDNPTTILRVKP